MENNYRVAALVMKMVQAWPGYSQVMLPREWQGAGDWIKDIMTEDPALNAGAWNAARRILDGGADMAGKLQFPQAGHAVRIGPGNPWEQSVRPGSLGIIGGLVGKDIQDEMSITFNVSGAFRGASTGWDLEGPLFVSCSGGPATITTPVFELKPTSEIAAVTFWAWRELPRRDGGYNYTIPVPVWIWSGEGG